MEDRGRNDPEPRNRALAGNFINIEVALLKKDIAMDKPTLAKVCN